MSEYSSGRLVHLSGPPGRIFSHRYFPCSQEISEVCLSGHRIRVYENSLWPRFGHQGFKKMCGSSSDAIKEWRDQSFIIKHHHHSTFIPEASREQYGHTSEASGEIRFQDKPAEELSNSCTGNSLLGSQVEFSDVLSIPIRGSHQDISQLPFPFSTRENSLFQNESSATGSDGLNTVSGSSGTAANEGFSKLDSVTGHLPQEPSQLQFVLCMHMFREPAHVVRAISYLSCGLTLTKESLSPINAFPTGWWRLWCYVTIIKV